ncbi:hypothetical protein AKJ65_01100 [candidate division MSBL1 archaeon SCGC-AAA259E19]|uniref:Hydrogenase maturation protease n=1 Tax=candidate division MSBL1 archaeon SCGC-AAA259E19 TaxID=1698264 RepID=A0A133UND6_9EURY|nr:hypothetical protein AKJ65_01100 [candidate division MSBL1 archaeon SCGC-AAA259E19]
MARKGVIGLGNPVRGDDGISEVLIRRLSEESSPSDVEFIDIGTGSVKALHVLGRLDKAIILDAVFFGGDPGEYVFFDPEEVKSLKRSKNPHDSTLFEVLELSRKMEELPEEIQIMGIQPKDVSLKEGLSPELESEIPKLLNALRQKIAEL